MEIIDGCDSPKIPTTLLPTLIGGEDAVGVLYFEAVSEDDRKPIEDTELFRLQATEGRIVLRTHLAKERDRGLIIAKRNEVRAAHRELICEACDLTESQLPRQMGEACFETHHTTALASLTEETQRALLTS